MSHPKAADGPAAPDGDVEFLRSFTKSEIDDFVRSLTDSYKKREAAAPRPEWLSLDETWEIAKAYLEYYGMVNHHIQSFDIFADRDIQGLLDALPDIEECKGVRNSDNYELVRIRYLKCRLIPPKLQEKGRKKITILPNHDVIKTGADMSDVTPRIAMQRKLTYAGKLYLDLVKEVETKRPGQPVTKTETLYENLFIGEIPVIVKSKYCMLNQLDARQLEELGEDPSDPGGYLIVNGGRKVVVMQERMCSNKALVFAKQLTGGKISIEAEIRSIRELSYRPPSLLQLRFKSSESKSQRGQEVIRASIPYLKPSQDIPLCILFKALGVLTDRDIAFACIYRFDDEGLCALIKPSLEEASAIRTQAQALEYIAKRTTNTDDNKDNRIKYVMDLLARDLLPHVGVGVEDFALKSWQLGYIAHLLMLVKLGRREQDNRDFYANKRVIAAGPLFAEYLSQLFQKNHKEMRRRLRTKMEEGSHIDISALILDRTITQAMKYAAATGNWNIHKQNRNKNGITAPLNNLSQLSALCHKRRTNTPVGREGKLSKPRHLTGPKWGRFCPAENPEGKNIGLVNNMALLTYISMGDLSATLLDLVFKSYVIPLLQCTKEQLVHGVKVHVNKAWKGVTMEPGKTFDALKAAKLSFQINPETSVYHDGSEIFIDTDAGRCMRPVLCVSDGKLALTRDRILQFTKRKNPSAFDGWMRFMQEGLVELIDTSEEDNTYIAFFPQNVHDNPGGNYTHCEIHPCTILGPSASLIPFPDHNPASRNSFQANMGKASISAPPPNFQQCMDTMMHYLNYPQRPLVETKAMVALGMNEQPQGFNAIVAVMNFTGFQQDDAIIINRAFIDRAGARSTLYRTYCDEEKKIGPQYTEHFEKPKKGECYGMKQGSYEHLDEQDGLAILGSRIQGGDIVIGKTTDIPNLPPDAKLTKKCHSVQTKAHESGIVDAVILTVNTENQRTAKVRVRSEKIPIPGDKFSSRHGQKGVCAAIYLTEDMPFSQVTGMTPDIIIGSQAFPGRQTVGHLVEQIFSKGGALMGKIMDGTPFEVPLFPEDEENTSPFDTTRVKEAVDLVRQSGFDACRGYKTAGELRAKGGFAFEAMGSEPLVNGMTGRPIWSEIYMGPVFYQRLKHIADDKIHARSTGPVNLLTMQPTEGRARDGGLRFGEMERDCDLAHGAAFVLQNQLMWHSDARKVPVCKKCGLIAMWNSETNKKGCKSCDTGKFVTRTWLPNAFKLLTQELMCLGIAPRLVFEKDDI
jgi:DNA-directed RNA polymerase II subunit RPB2